MGDAAANAARTAEKPAAGRMLWLDAARGMAMVFIIIGHCGFLNDFERNLIFSFHVPLFFILSGFTYRKKPNRLGKYAKQLLVPYLVTSALVILFWVLRPYEYYTGVPDILKAVLFGSGNLFGSWKAIGEIWFFPALLIARLLMDLIFTLKKEWVRGVLCFALLIPVYVLHRFGIWLPLSADIAMAAVSFLYIGHLVRKYSDTVLYWPLIIFFAGFWILSVSYTSMSLSARDYGIFPFAAWPGAVAGSMVVIGLCKLLCRDGPLTKALAWVGRHTILILCIHSLDWRMLFALPGGKLQGLNPGHAWNVFIFLVRRFVFDLGVAGIVLGLREGAARLLQHKKEAS